MGKWIFYETPSKPTLTSEEVRYWKTNLDRILKAGIEFEFNLPSNKGKCYGDLRKCPCVKFGQMLDIDEVGCWQECGNKDKCTAEHGEEFIKSNCTGITCSNYISACVTCEEKVTDCESCKYLYDPKKDPDNIRRSLREELSPSNTYGKINESGVHSIVCDGSLLGSGEEGKGAEIITTGRRVDYWEFFKMNKKIIDESLSKGAYVNERCSIHVHLLASYYNNLKLSMRGDGNASELEKPLPQIILANFHQLCRKYQNAMTWMSMALDKETHLTRWEKYRASILDISPLRRNMREIISMLEQRTGKSGGKYGWVNYMFMRFNSKHDLNRFHLEMRVMDGNMSPSAVTAMTCLFYALVIKAVEISRYGLLEVGSQEEVEEAFSIKERLLNNNPEGWGVPHRFSDYMLDEKQQDILIQQSLELIYQVKHILLKLGPAYDVLEQLAYQPIAFRRVEGKTWEEIEEELAVYIPTETRIEKLISISIDTREFIGCASEKDWIIKITKAVKEEDAAATPEVVEQILQAGKDFGEYVWAKNIGTMLKV